MAQTELQKAKAKIKRLEKKIDILAQDKNDLMRQLREYEDLKRYMRDWVLDNCDDIKYNDPYSYDYSWHDGSYTCSEC